MIDLSGFNDRKLRVLLLTTCAFLLITNFKYFFNLYQPQENNSTIETLVQNYNDFKNSSKSLAIHNNSTTLVTLHKQPITNKFKFNHDQILNIDTQRSRYNICSVLMSECIIVYHHKTGHDLTSGICRGLSQFCAFKGPKQLNKIPLTPEWETMVNIKNKMNKTYFHFTRAPIDTIISGYFYHTHIPGESWATQNMIKKSIMTGSGRPNKNALYIDILNDNIDERNFYSKYMMHSRAQKTESRQLLHCFETNILQKLINTTTTTINFDSLNMNISLQLFYSQFNMTNIDMGLFWEFVRYFNCEWPSIFVSRQIGTNNFSHYIEFMLSDFETQKGFDNSINVFLNNLLRKIKKVNIDVDNLRNHLFYVLGKNYISKDKGRQKVHVTKNMYDKNKVMQDFLGLDKKLCVIVKNMTVFLDQKWIYSAYC